ncbi:MAG: BACON domain-containing protein [Bacteroidales bacterium]|nr:BACON domain-containing protein [Bacteroidales bacterium]
MKLKYLILSILAGAALMGCEKEFEISSLADFKAEPSYLGIAVNGGTVSSKVEADASWSFESVPDWLTVNPTSGGAGSATIQFSAGPNESPSARKAELKVKVGNDYQIFTIVQTGAGEAPISTIAEVSAGDDGKVYRIRGTVTSIANTSYGNFYVADDTGEIYVYGVKNNSGQYPKDAEGGWGSFGIEVGDVVTVEGPRTLYNSTLELVDAAVVKVEKSLIKTNVSEVALAKEAGEFTIKVESSLNPLAIYPDVDWITLEEISGANVIFSYTENDAIIKRTGNIIIKGEGALKSIPVTQDPREIDPARDILTKTIADVLASPEDAMLYRIKGVITSIANATYGNVYIADGTGEVYVYGLTATKQESNDKSFESLGLKVGDVVTLIGNHSSYKGTAQMANSFYESHIPVADATVADFLAAPASTEQYFRLTGKVSNIASDVYGNFDLTDETGTVYVYGLTRGPIYAINDNAYGKFANNKVFGELGVKEGSTITIEGFRGEYKGSPQAIESFLITIVDEPTPDPDPDQPVAGEYDSNVSYTLGTSTYDDGLAIVNGTENVKTLKFGTSKKYGDLTLKVPAGTTKLTYYAVAWKGNASKLQFTWGENTKTQDVAANDGATGNAPYTITVADSDKYTLDFGSALAAETEIKVETVETGYRAILFGVQAVK